MSEPNPNTQSQSPDDLARVLSPGSANPIKLALAAGAHVPGLSSWLLERKLGGGGFGEVWLTKHAWDAEQKPRAVKFCTDPDARHRLVTHERDIVVRVLKSAGKHPNIVPLLDCNLDGDTPWLMYEFVEGGTLANLIEQWHKLPLTKRFSYAIAALHAVAGGLAACHRLAPPLVHRDLKPANVLMAGRTPRITDFGIGGVGTRPTGGTATGGPTPNAAQVPSAVRHAGTRAYAPPEQLYGSPPNPRDDVFALGVMAYQMLKGDLRSAPGADTALELNELRIPRDVTTLIVRSVAMNPDRRPKDAGEWEATLGALLTKSRPPSSGRKPASGPSSVRIRLNDTEVLSPEQVAELNRSAGTEVLPEVPAAEVAKAAAAAPVAPEPVEPQATRARVVALAAFGALALAVIALLIVVFSR